MVPYAVAVNHLYSTDVLSYRYSPRSVLGRAIAVAGRGFDCHTGLVDMSNGTPVAYGMRWLGQNIRAVSTEVAEHDGLIDVYRYVGYQRWCGAYPSRAQPAMRFTDRRAIVREVKRLALYDGYGFWSAARTAGYFVPGLRWFCRPGDRVALEEINARPPFCSQAVFHGFASVGEWLLRNRTPAQVLPSDIVTSPLLMYCMTLTRIDPLPQLEAAPGAKRLRPIEDYHNEARRLANCSVRPDGGAYDRRRD